MARTTLLQGSRKTAPGKNSGSRRRMHRGPASNLVCDGCCPVFCPSAQFRFRIDIVRFPSQPATSLHYYSGFGLTSSLPQCGHWAMSILSLTSQLSQLCCHASGDLNEKGALKIWARSSVDSPKLAKTLWFPYINRPMALPQWWWCTNFCTTPPPLSQNLNSWGLLLPIVDFWLLFWQLPLLLGRTSLSSIPCPLLPSRQLWRDTHAS